MVHQVTEIPQTMTAEEPSPLAYWTPEEHKARHVQLHQALDELAADFIVHTRRRISSSTVMELMEWSHRQTIEPTER